MCFDVEKRGEFSIENVSHLKFPPRSFYRCLPIFYYAHDGSVSYFDSLFCCLATGFGVLSRLLFYLLSENGMQKVVFFFIFMNEKIFFHEIWLDFRGILFPLVMQPRDQVVTSLSAFSSEVCSCWWNWRWISHPVIRWSQGKIPKSLKRKPYSE